MRHFFFVIALSLHVGYALTPNSFSSSTKNGSRNLLDKNTNSVRSARCAPCDQNLNSKRPISNHLDSDYRGNGADNLGYDWSPMAWGGLAYPQISKMMYAGGSRGRDGKMMAENWRRDPGNTRVVCDTCRSYWDDGRSGSRGRGRQFNMNSYYGGVPGTWDGDKMIGTKDYETRVVSPTVGVLVKPGSRIAYIPSRSGEMYWDGVSGGGTRWDGFSNGISWIGNGVSSESDWDRMDTDPRGEKQGYGTNFQRPESDYRFGSNNFGPWDDGKVRSWSDDLGRGYYFSNGIPNKIDPQWRDRGYASNWHYGNTNQNGWNGNNMKWNYGKQWTDNDRAANRFYFNGPQDRTYAPTDGHRFQYGNQYPNYQPINFRPQPSWPTSSNYRPNDKFPSDFQQGNYGGDDNRPWDYTSRDPTGFRRPGFRPEWARPDPSYPSGGKFESGKFPQPQRGYDKFSQSDKNNYEKPWVGTSGYGPAKPSGFPYGGNRYPGQSSSRPNFPMDGGHLFYPNEGNRQPGYPESASGGLRPTYFSEGNTPGGYSTSGNQIGTYPGDNNRPSGEYPTRPTVIYTGGKPSGGTYPSGSTNGGYSSTSGGQPSGYPGSPGEFPIKGDRPVGYPGTYQEGHRPNGYPGGGSRPDGLYSTGGSGGFPSGGPGSYPSAGLGSYPSVGPGSYSSGGSGNYPSAGSSSYPSGGSNSFSGSSGGYPSGGLPSRPSYPSEGGLYPTGNRRPGFYPAEQGGSSPAGYPSGGNRPTGYPSEPNRPDRYPLGGRPQIYPGADGYSQGSKNPPKGYYTGFITELGPDDVQLQYGGKNPNYFGGRYPSEKNFYSDRDRDRYFYGGDSNRYEPNRNDRFPGYPGSGGYPVRDKDNQDRNGDKYYNGQSGGKGHYPGRFPANHRYPGAGDGSDFDRNQGSTNDKNAWNYSQNDHKEGIYRRSGGSYPPYRGGQYYTSSYLASMSTTAGSTPGGTEPKTQSATKADEVTQPTPDSS